jgi:hypothetical protein
LRVAEILKSHYYSSMKILTFGILLSFSLEVFGADLDLIAIHGKGLDTNGEAFKSQYVSLTWKGDESSAKDLKLFEQALEAVVLENKDDAVKAVHFRFEASGSANQAKTRYNDLGKVLRSRLGEKNLKVMSDLHINGVKRSRVAWNLDKSVSVYEMRSTSGMEPELWLSVYEKNAGLAYLTRKGYEGGGRSGEKGGKSAKDGDFDQDEVKKEHQAKIKEILKRESGRGISKESQDATNLLNVYRYLCGVSYDVPVSEKLNANAEKAAQACSKANTLSHDLGNFTDQCNLAMSTGSLTMESTVTQYIDDAGDNNRQRRGHRRWCINHTMGKVGFGLVGNYSAMFCFDFSGENKRENYAYPGIGAFPLEYLHGNAWSYYLVSGEFPAKCEVQVYKLDEPSTKLPAWSDKVKGTALPVPYVSPFQSSLNFEPQESPVTEPGSYLVRIEAGNIKEQYLVHLYR